MSAQFRRASVLSFSLAGALLLSSGCVARAQNIPAPDAQPMGLRVALSPEQAQQIISERLLQDGVATATLGLRQSLALTPRQDERWRAFMAASMARPTADMFATLSQDDATPLGQARMGLDLQREQLRLDARRVRAMERLYRTLDERQKAMFDQGYAMIASLAVAKVSSN